ncbi:hypothetical protein TNCV_3644691 [Trichonephila clavipes]|nr:hypothetical protein TNCV_3644691 [Trichonephila clavipes]
MDTRTLEMLDMASVCVVAVIWWYYVKRVSRLLRQVSLTTFNCCVNLPNRLATSHLSIGSYTFLSTSNFRCVFVLSRGSRSLTPHISPANYRLGAYESHIPDDDEDRNLHPRNWR